jgi:hypothetical protein
MPEFKDKPAAPPPQKCMCLHCVLLRKDPLEMACLRRIVKRFG